MVVLTAPFIFTSNRLLLKGAVLQPPLDFVEPGRKGPAAGTPSHSI